MHTIVLHGAAAERFGGPFILDVRDCREALRAIGCQRPAFIEMLKQSDWRIHRGPLDKGADLDEQSIGMAIGRAGELHLIPVAAGSVNGKGIGKIVAGVALVALSFTGVGAAIGGVAYGATISAAAFGLGASIALGGVAMLLAKTPQASNPNDREAEPGSKMFNGTGPNLTEPGHPYPLALGRIVRCGSVVGQVGLTTEQML